MKSAFLQIIYMILVSKLLNKNGNFLQNFSIIFVNKNWGKIKQILDVQNLYWNMIDIDIKKYIFSAPKSKKNTKRNKESTLTTHLAYNFPLLGINSMTPNPLQNLSRISQHFSKFIKYYFTNISNIIWFGRVLFA